jgi:hypothetical protein
MMLMQVDIGMDTANAPSFEVRMPEQVVLLGAALTTPP